MKPIWKSVGFWMGGVVLVFLLWAWGDSMWWVSSCHRSNYMEGKAVSSRGGRILYTHWTMAESEWPWHIKKYGSRNTPKKVFYFKRRKIESGGHFEIYESDRLSPSWFQEFDLKFMEKKDFGNQKGRLALPYWMIILSYVVVWVGYVGIFRRWQQKRLATKGT